MRVLVGYEQFGHMRAAFRRHGHDAWSCDLMPARDGSPFHFQCNVFDVINDGWDLGIFHPERYPSVAQAHDLGDGQLARSTPRSTNQRLRFHLLIGLHVPDELGGVGLRRRTLPRRLRTRRAFCQHAGASRIRPCIHTGSGTTRARRRAGGWKVAYSSCCRHTWSSRASSTGSHAGQTRPTTDRTGSRHRLIAPCSGQRPTTVSPRPAQFAGDRSDTGRGALCGPNRRAKVQCQCGYPATPCDKKKHDYGHDCVAGNERGGLKPQNIVQAAEADIKRAKHNSKEFEYDDPLYEPYAFHREHARRAKTAHELMLLALMDPMVKTEKANTKLIYGNAGLLIEALKSSRQV